MDSTLLQLARHRVWNDAREKKAVVAPGGGAPPPGMDPAAMGGAPPGGAPPMDPSMMGGAPPQGGMPPMDPSMMGGAPPGGAPPMPGAAPPMPGAAPPMMGDPAQAAAMGQPAPKLKPEQMMQMLDFRIYNMQMQLTAIMSALNVTLPPGALVTPPGSPTPVAEAAVPGGPQDPTQNAAAGVGGGGGGGGDSAISPIQGIQGASPELAGGGGGGEKTGSNDWSFADLIDNLTDRASEIDFSADQTPAYTQSNTKVAGVGTPYAEIFETKSLVSNAAAVAAMLRSRTAHNAN